MERKDQRELTTDGDKSSAVISGLPVNCPLELIQSRAASLAASSKLAAAPTPELPPSRRSEG